MSQDPYIVLGISRDADFPQIRSAHHRLVRLYHPDTGSGETDALVDVRRAYEQLKREHLTASCLLESRRRHARSRPAAEPLVPSEPYDSQAESLAPSHYGETPGSLFGAIDEFLSGWVPGMFTRGGLVSKRKDLYLDVLLTVPEAERGGEKRLVIPISNECEWCGGSGRRDGQSCPSCSGHGNVRLHRQISLVFPRRVPDGKRLQIPLSELGLKNVFLNILVTILH